MTNLVIRHAKRVDCKEIRRLIQELADFEKMPDSVKLDVATLEADGFDTDKPPFQSIVVEDPENAGQLIGYALYFVGYATWNGKKLYLEDIMITERYRKFGIGSLLFSKICQEAIKLDCKVMYFVVLKWNPATEFYNNMGAENLTDKENWHYYRLNENQIKEFSNKQISCKLK